MKRALVIFWALASLATAAATEQAGFDASLAARRAGHRDRAILGFQRVLQSQPTNGRAWYELGLSYAMDYQYAKAADAYRLALSNQYPDPACHCALALALREAKHARAALAEAKDCRDKLPAYAGAWNLLGNVQVDLQDSQGAVESYRKAVELRPGYGNAQYNLAVTLEGLGQDAESEAAYRTALQLEPGMAEAWLGLGNVQLRQQHAAGAGISFRKAIALGPERADAEWGLSRALSALGKKAEAKEHEMRYRRLLARADHEAQLRQGQLKRTPIADEAWE